MLKMFALRNKYCMLAASEVGQRRPGQPGSQPGFSKKKETFQGFSEDNVFVQVEPQSAGCLSSRTIRGGHFPTERRRSTLFTFALRMTHL